MQRLAISLVNRELDLETGLVEVEVRESGAGRVMTPEELTLAWVLDDKRRHGGRVSVKPPQGHFEEFGTGKWNGECPISQATTAMVSQLYNPLPFPRSIKVMY